MEGDKTWMQGRESLQSYYFILFIALHLYSQVLDHLRRKDLLIGYSIHDILWQLSKVYLVDVDGRASRIASNSRTGVLVSRVDPYNLHEGEGFLSLHQIS